MNKTPIEWTTYSANPFKMRLPDGTLLNVCVHKSAGCANCYAESIVRRWWKKAWGDFPGYTAALLKLGTPVLVDEELNAVLRLSNRIAKGKADPSENKVFWNDMTDEFLDFWPDEFIDKLFAVRALTPNLIHQVLTKRAERMCGYLSDVCGKVESSNRIRRAINEIPATLGDRRGALELPLFNVHLGVSVEDQKNADERISLLLQIPAAVRFISYEPALGPVDLTRISTGQGGDNDASSIDSLTGVHYIDAPVEPVEGRGLDWVIAGGESGAGARPFDLSWGRSVVQQCKAAGVACFVKQLGSRPYENAGPDFDPSLFTGDRKKPTPFLQLKDGKGGNMSEWPKDLQVRQFPE